MDEIVNKLEATVVQESPSNFENLYKWREKKGAQEERRKKLLQIQKSNRSKTLDGTRGILDLVQAIEEEYTEKLKKKGPEYRPKIYVAGFTTVPASYKNVFMLSEWLVEKPEDFHDNWYVVPCPLGIRLLVVASQGITKCYTKYGMFYHKCHTALPGGNPIDCYQSHNQCCVLDCFYDERNQTMHVLDLLAWNSQPMTDGETEFRHYWLKEHLKEIPELKTIGKKNKLIFSLLPMVPCSKDSLNSFMMKFPVFNWDSPSLDGLLFYHKKAHYVSGETPLVGWLYPFMVPEVLGSNITVHRVYMNAKPPGYVNQSSFIEEFERKRAIKKKRRYRPWNTLMDTFNPDNQEATEKSEVMETEEKSKTDNENKATEAQNGDK